MVLAAVYGTLDGGFTMLYERELVLAAGIMP